MTRWKASPSEHKAAAIVEKAKQDATNAAQTARDAAEKEHAKAQAESDKVKAQTEAATERMKRKATSSMQDGWNAGAAGGAQYARGGAAAASYNTGIQEEPQ